MRLIRWSLPFALGVSLLMAEGTASADEVSPDGKGITGGALLGAEAVMLIEAAIKVKPAWAYVVGGLAGGVAGGVGGYFAEQGGDAKLSLYLFAGGMALVIPTTVAVLSATAYEPPANYTEDRGPTDEPVAEPPQPEAAPSEPVSQRTRKPLRRLRSKSQEVVLYQTVAPPALVGLTDQGSLMLSMPALEVRQAYTREERFKYGVKEVAELRVPVFNVLF